MNQVLQKVHGNKKITTKIFIEKAQKIHKNEYSYIKSSYTKYHNKLIITCSKHGDFQQSPYVHLRGSGCPLCYGNEKLTIKEFIQRAQKIHNDKYDYNLVIYENNKTKIKISCPIHGEFEQTPTRHLCGDGCPKCGIIVTANKNKRTTLQFIKEAQKIHGNKYDYSKSTYLGCYEPLIIICSKHGEFTQKPIIHINCNSGCPDCGNNSKGEITIKTFFEKNQIKFERQKMFDNCNGIKRKLPFDFYLPNNNYMLQTW